jgi:hypothetical protein
MNTSLKATLAANKASLPATSSTGFPNAASPAVVAAPAITSQENRVESLVEKELPLPDDPKDVVEHHFHVFNHPYQFKIDGKVLKPTKENIYIPTTKEEFDFLVIQVGRGLIHFY